MQETEILAPSFLRPGKPYTHACLIQPVKLFSRRIIGPSQVEYVGYTKNLFVLGQFIPERFDVILRKHSLVVGGEGVRDPINVWRHV